MYVTLQTVAGSSIVDLNLVICLVDLVRLWYDVSNNNRCFLLFSRWMPVFVGNDVIGVQEVTWPLLSQLCNRKVSSTLA